MTAAARSPRSRRPSPRVLVVGGVAVVAFAVRAVLVLTTPSVAVFPGTDDTWYHSVARSIERGDFGLLPGVDGTDVLSTRFPPAYPVVLSLGRWPLFWMEAVDAHQWTGVLLGALAAATVAALAWRLAGSATPRRRVLVSATAGLLFAANPIVAGASSALMAEALVLPVVALVLLVIDRLGTGEGRTLEAVALGGLVAVGALTRSETVFVLAVAVLGGWLAFRRSRHAVRKWLLPLAVGAIAVIAWSAVVSVSAGRAVLMSTNSGSLLLGANCVDTHNFEVIGYWSGDCLAVPAGDLSPETRRRARTQANFLERNFLFPPQLGAPGEAEINAAQFDAALSAIRDHPRRTARAVPFRLLRGLGLYWSPRQDFQEAFEGRRHTAELAGRWFNIVLILPFTLVTLLGIGWRRSRLGTGIRELVDTRRLAPSLALMGAWAVTIVLSYGSARFRATIEPSLALFAGIGIAFVVSAVSARSSRSEAR